MCIKYLLLILLFVSLGQSAEAKVSQSTSYNYFKVQGKMPREIYISLLKHAKGPSGHDAYATTTTRIYQKTNFAVGKNCSFKNYGIIGRFKITLPKLVGADGASAATKQSWAGFANVLKRHEEHHRDLWMACVRSFENQVRDMSAKSCGQLATNFKKLWKAMQKNCDAQNSVFDKQEQFNFLRQPFIQMVLRGK